MRERRDAEEPLTWTMPSANACAGIYLATRATEARPRVRAFRDGARLWEAYARDEVVLEEVVRCTGAVTSVGRHLVWRCVAAAMEPRGKLDEPWWHPRIRAALDRIARRLHVEAAARCAEVLDRFGSYVFARSGFSLGLADFAPAAGRAERIADGFAKTRAIQTRFENGEMTDVERFYKVSDAWSEILYQERDAVRRGRRVDDPLHVADAAAVDADPRVTASLTRFRAMRGMVTDEDNRSERPVLHSVGDGLDAHESMDLWSRFRRGELRRAETDASVAALFGDLDAALEDVRVVERDCGTSRGTRIDQEYDEDIPARAVFAAAIEFRVLAADVTSGGKIVATRGTLISVDLAETIASVNVPFVTVRDPVACESRDGVCAHCTGLDPDDFTWLQPGDGIGARAARHIARESRKFGLPRVFRIC